MKIVIVGAGLAGIRTAEHCRRAGFDGELVLIGDEPHLPYDRPPLSKKVLRGDALDSTLEPEQFFADNRIDLRLGTSVSGLDTETRTITLQDGSSIGYDNLVIATGLRPRRLRGLADLAGVHVLRSMDDCVGIRAELNDARAALVVGGGFIGCEVAASLRDLGHDVTLVEPQNTVLESVLGTVIGGLVQRLHTERGVKVLTGVGVDSWIGGDRVQGAVLSDESSVTADIVVVGIGSTPATDWLRGSGLTVSDGIEADGTGRTSSPHVWAVGDVASWDLPGVSHRAEHWSNVLDQVKLMVPSLLGAEVAAGTPGVPYFWSDQYDMKIQALGTPSALDRVTVVEDDGRKFLAYYDRGGRLTAVVGAGMGGKVMKMRAAVASGASMDELGAVAR
ncbi:FAD-dependent oxidoreductase [Rhodococcus sp. NPDC079359]|uniref:NAD(P)/FAD-dependent oxidoreductase n=1 Tax=Rhodococcus sp. NPDC079359 TaxID=3154961 RepID=UPI00344D5A45